MATDTETAYRHSIRLWNAYATRPEVRVSSNPRAITECDAYGRLVALGKSIFPLLYDTFSTQLDAPATPGLAMLVKEIAGEEFQIPSNLHGDARHLRNYTLDFLAQAK